MNFEPEISQHAAAFKYRAFLSYNKKDARIAERISKQLLENRIDVWLDRWSLYAGDSLTDTIAKAIAHANIFLLVASVNSMGSPWVHEELTLALSRRISDPNFRLLTVKIDDCVLHPFLQDYLWIELKNPRQMNRAIRQILAAVLQIDLKPTLKKFSSRFYLNLLRYSIRFSRHRGATTLVSEFYDLTTLEDVKSIKKHLYHSGGLAKKEFLPNSPGLSGKIAVIEKTTAMERLEISFDKTLAAGTNWQFIFNHEIKDNFLNDEEFVYYTIESPTKEIRFEFKFSAECRVSKLRIYERLGQEEMLIRSTRSDRGISYTHYLPVLNHTLVFRWAWVT